MKQAEYKTIAQLKREVEKNSLELAPHERIQVYSRLALHLLMDLINTGVACGLWEYPSTGLSLSEGPFHDEVRGYHRYEANVSCNGMVLTLFMFVHEGITDFDVKVSSWVYPGNGFPETALAGLFTDRGISSSHYWYPEAVARILSKKAKIEFTR